MKSMTLVVLILLTLTAALATAESPTNISAQFTRNPQTTFHLECVVGKYLTRVSENWLKLVPESNPAILEMFRDRERKPYRLMEPWAGEFAGKYLTGAVQVFRLTHDQELKSILNRFVNELVSLQAGDGYLGPWPQDSRLTGHAPNMTAKGGPTWDAWGHYHVMLGLLLWHEETGDAIALKCATSIGDLLCNKFLGDKSPRLVDTGSTEMNLAPIDSLCMLYQHTHNPRHLDLAKQIANEFAAKDPEGKPLAGDYLDSALAGKEFYQSPKPRWESLHPILGLVRLYYLTGDVRYRQAFEHWWWSIVKLDRHNNGGFSSGEQAQGNPYHQGAIETCCTIAWLAMSVEMLKLTGNSIVADELELSTLNSVIGLHSPSGRWCTYNTPMDGVRKASAHDIVFQAREGSPELNCCSVNSARGFGLISDWALLQDKEGLVLNWYGPGSMTTTLPNGSTVKLTQQTDYPKQGKIHLMVVPSHETAFTIKLRIPQWSTKTSVEINGKQQENIKPGTYLSLHRSWKPGDTIEIKLDFTLHYWAGEKECAGKVSLYLGPILLAYDRQFNTVDPEQIPVLDVNNLQCQVIQTNKTFKPIILLEISTTSGIHLNLCDFGSAGNGGSPYLSWLKANNAKPASFSKTNTLLLTNTR